MKDNIPAPHYPGRIGEEMDKVKELVEWVTDIVKNDDGLDQQQLYADFEIDHYTDIAKQILSHPDLALIIKCDLCKGQGWLPDDDTGEPIHPVGGTRCPECESAGTVPIPLAEALKDK